MAKKSTEELENILGGTSTTNIDEIQSIEFNLRIVDEATWEEIATTDAITLNFE